MAVCLRLAAGGSVALMAPTNEVVERLNTKAQQHRIRIGELEPTGRHVTAGIFTLGAAGLVERVDRGTPVDLDFGTPERLLRSLEQPTENEWLTRARDADDVMAVKAMLDLPEVRERIGEVRYGDWTGQALKTLVKEPLWKAVQAHPSSVTFPGGEALRAMQERAVDAVDHRPDLVVGSTGTLIWQLPAPGMAHFQQRASSPVH